MTYTRNRRKIICIDNQSSRKYFKKYNILSRADKIQIFILICLSVTAIISICQLNQNRNFIKESLRPWAYINLNKSKISTRNDNNRVRIAGISHTGVCKNIGQKPAMKFIMKSYYGNTRIINIDNLINSDSLFQNKNYYIQKGWTVFPNDSSIFELFVPLSIAADTASNKTIIVEYLLGVLISYEDNSGNRYKTKQIFKEHLERTSIISEGKINWILNPSELLFSNPE